MLRTEEDLRISVEKMPSTGKSNASSFMAAMYDHQIDAIKRYYPRMDAETRKRADETLKQIELSKRDCEERRRR